MSTARTLLTLAQVAERYPWLTENTLRYYRKLNNKGPRTIKIGRRVLIDEADLDAWIEAQMQADAARRGTGGDAA